MNTDIMSNRQRSLFHDMVTRQLPSLFKEYSGTDLGNFRIDFDMFPFSTRNAIEENGTLFAMLKAVCKITNKMTGEEHCFNLDLLKIPVYTESGFRIKNNYMQILDLYSRTTGWCFASDYSDDVDDELKGNFDKRYASLVAIGQSSIKFCYQKSNGIIVRIRKKAVPVKVFFRALTNITAEELIEMFDMNNPYIVDSLISSKTSKDRLPDNLSRTACIDMVYNALYPSNGKDRPLKSIPAKQKAIQDAYFNQRRLNLGKNYSGRLLRSMSFTFNAEGKELAEDVIFDSKLLCKAGEILDFSTLQMLDNKPINKIAVKTGGKIFYLRKFSNFTFRALGYKLKNDCCGIEKGKDLTLEDLEILNNSDYSAITVIDSNGKERIFTRRVRPKTLALEDLYTVFGLYANILNGYDVYDNQYELTNRVVTPFNKKILEIVERNLVKYIDSLSNGLASLSEENLLLEGINSSNFQLDEFLNEIANPEDAEAQMADLNNSLHYISKCYKVTTDVKASEATEKLRRVQDLQLGRTDSIDSPESGKIGLVHQRTLLAKETDDGYLTAPYLKIKDGIILDEEPVYLTAQEEIGMYIAEWDEDFFEVSSSGERILKKRIKARHNGNIVTIETNKVTLKEYTQLQNMSPARSLIPFMGNSNAKRLLMACNHQKQAVATIKAERPIVATGCEAMIPLGNYIASDVLKSYYDDMVVIYPELAEYRDRILSGSLSIDQDGVRDQKKTRKIRLIVNEVRDLVESGKLSNCEYVTNINIPYMQKTSEKSVFSFRLNAPKNGVYRGDDVIASNLSFYQDDGKKVNVVGDYGGLHVDEKVLKQSYGPGINFVVGYKTYATSTIDDAICISSRLVYDETLTSITMISKIVELHSNSDKLEFFGLPNDFDGKKHKLDGRGLAVIGAYLNPGDVYACVISNSNQRTSVQYKYLDEYTYGQVVSADIKQKDGKEYAEVLLAARSDIECGDKMSGRCGNKGVVSRIIPEEEMPYDPKTGLVLDVILNPLGIPSRMNITQLLDCVLALAMKRKDEYVALAPYYKYSMDYVREQAAAMDVKPMYLCDGRTGELFKRPVNVGIQYMFKLIHMVKKKINAISLEEPIDPIFQQPLKGQKNEGGQSFGEMEAWCLQGIGATKLLQETYSTESDDVEKKIELEKKLTNGDLVTDVIGENRNDLIMQTFTRSLGIDVTLEDGVYSFRPLTDAKIRSLSTVSVNDENDLHSEAIFGSDNTPLAKMRGKERWSFIDLHTEIVSPFWMYKGILNRLLGVIVVTLNQREEQKLSKPQIASSGLFYSILNRETYVERTIASDRYPTIYKQNSGIIPPDAITGNEAILYIFKNYRIEDTVPIYSRDIERKKLESLEEDNGKEELENNKDFLKMVKSLNSLKDNIAAGISLSDYVISAFPVMPQTFRPLMKGGSRHKTSDFDKSYKQILADVRNITQGVTDSNVLALIQDIEQFLGFEKLAKQNLSLDKDRTNIIKWFTGSGDDSNAKHHGKIRENTLSKKMFCAGRSVIIPTSMADMKPTHVGVPLSMIVKLYKQPLVGWISNRLFSSDSGRERISRNTWRALFNAIGGHNIQKFTEVYNSKFAGIATDPDSNGLEPLSATKAYDLIRKEIIDYVENGEVVELGRQPSLHQFSIRAFYIKVVDTKAIQIHPLVCGGYNADFDGDTVWLKAILSASARKEAIDKMSPASVLVNPKDSSLIMVPAQDVALGLYCATMLKNNAADIYETPEVLEDIRFYADLGQLEADIDLGIVEYYSLVVYRADDKRYYYSTAGRILFNAILPDGFTDKPFSNVLHLPIPSVPGFSSSTSLKELKYDGVVAGKGGTRKDVAYCKLSKICEGFVKNYPDSCIDYYQAITKFGFHASDLNSVTLSLDDICIEINPAVLQKRYKKRIKLLDWEREQQIITDSEYKHQINAARSNLLASLAGDANNCEDAELKHKLMKQADEKKEELEFAYQVGLVHASDRKDGIQNIYKTILSEVKDALPAAMDRNNNLFIIYDSGSRGNIGQIMQTAGAIGILQKTKSENMEMPVTGNYAEGISSFDTYVTSYSARTGVASTQNETQTAGHATRTAVYMLNGIKIIEDDCGKENWWYDVQWGDFKNEVKLRPSNAFVEKKLNGKHFDFDDGETKKLLHDVTADGAVTPESIRFLQSTGFSTLALVNPDGSKEYVDISLDKMKGARVAQEDVLSQKHLKNFLHSGKITNECLSMIIKAKLKRIYTEDGIYELYYQLDPVVRSLLVGREASTESMDGLPGLPYLEEVPDPNCKMNSDGNAGPKFKKIKCITGRTIDYIEEQRLERVPARILLDCHSKGGVCAHCYGRMYTNGEIPLVGTNVGIEAAQSLGEPSAQLTMSLFHTGGAAGTSIAGGVEILTHLLSGTKPGGADSETAVVSPHNGYVKLVKLDSQELGFVIPESKDCPVCKECLMRNQRCPIEINQYSCAFCKIDGRFNSSTLKVKDGQFIKSGDSITEGYVMPDSIRRNSEEPDEEILRKKQIVWLMAYFNTFRSNGIDINARHFEILARCQNLLVTVLDSGKTDLRPGKVYEFSELMRNYTPEDIATTTLSVKTSDKYDVVTHFSGPLTMLTFENVAGKAAEFVNSAYSSDTISLIGSTFVGNDLSKPGSRKELKQPAIVDLMLKDNPFSDSDFGIIPDDSVVDMIHNKPQEMEELGGINLDALDAFYVGEDEPESSAEPVEESAAYSSVDRDGLKSSNFFNGRGDSFIDENPDEESGMGYEPGSIADDSIAFESEDEDNLQPTNHVGSDDLDSLYDEVLMTSVDRDNKSADHKEVKRADLRSSNLFGSVKQDSSEVDLED